jgi:integrase
MLSDSHILPSPRLLDQLREVLRYRHYSLKTEKAYLYWVRFFIRWNGGQGPLRHPREMSADEVRAFLTMLATERKVSISTHNQALSDVLFLYREVLRVQLPWLTDIQRPTRPARIPSVLTHGEVAAVLGSRRRGRLLARLLYGSGLRLSEGLRLRVKDVDFDRRAIVVREGKGGKRRLQGRPRMRFGIGTGSAASQALRCRMRWTRNTPTSAGAGVGSGSFRHRPCQSTRAAALSADTICSSNVATRHQAGVRSGAHQ